LLHIKSDYVDAVIDAPDGIMFVNGNRPWSRRRSGPGPCEPYSPAIIAFVITTTETGFGTMGRKWDAMLLTMGRIIVIKNVWKVQDAWFNVHIEPR